LPGYDRVFDLPRFLMEQGRRFEQALLVDLQARWPVTRISTRPDEARSLAAAEATWDAMKGGAPVIASAVLRDPERRTFGVADLLVRSDILGELCPDAFIGDQLELPVAALRHGRHYRVVDVKFSTLHLLKDGRLGASDVDVMAQAWIYNEALGRLQGFTPPAAYVAGRAWRQGAARGDRCWERLARVPSDAYVRSRDEDLASIVARACAWIRRLRTEGAEWRVPPAAEAFVDFEFVHDLDDDFRSFPRKGGQSLIFQIGCGTYRGRRWSFEQFTVDDLGVDAEARMIDEWLAHLALLATAAGLASASDVRLVHWSLAEESNFERAYESARSRHPDREWPPLQWYDLLGRVFRAEPVVVRGAFSFGLKAIARALRAHGLIATEWGEGLADGAGAMAGAWSAAAESRARGRSLRESPVMREIAAYNQVDCRVMAEMLDHLRRAH